jgi:myo-inositol 2-dehydrogenase/D-chiro-inositol 1-dehydrogenase/scyllo-inositol 2-dehydrogenase (NAD+)
MAPGLRAGLVGCGTAGSAHAVTIQRHPGTELIACHDSDPARAKQVAGQSGARAVADLAELLALELDLIVVATGPVTQPDVVRRLAEQGFSGGMLCEKPLATSLDAGRDVVAAAEKAGITLAVNHQRRFGLAFEKAQEMLDAGAVGRLMRCEGYGESGTLLDWGPHWVDAALLLNGDAPVQWVGGMVDLDARVRHAGLELEWHSLIFWEHDNGVRGQLECGVRVLGQPLLRILGEDGVLEIGAPARGSARYGPALRVSSPDGPGWEQVDVGEGPLAAAQWQRGLDELLVAMRERRSPRHDAGRSLAALEVCLAGYGAGLDGRRRTLPLDPHTDIRTLVAGSG